MPEGMRLWINSRDIGDNMVNKDTRRAITRCHKRIAKEEAWYARSGERLVELNEDLAVLLTRLETTPRTKKKNNSSKLHNGRMAHTSIDRFLTEWEVNQDTIIEELATKHSISLEYAKKLIEIGSYGFAYDMGRL